MSAWQARYAKRRAAGLCVRCGEPAGGRAQCAACLARVHVWNQRYKPIRAGLAEPTVRPWTGAQLAKLRQMYAAGVPRAEIARATGRTVCAIDAQVDAHGLHRKQPPRFWTPARDAELRRLHATGALLREIGVVFGRSRQAITERTRRLGLKRGAGGDHRSKLARMQQRSRCACGLSLPCNNCLPGIGVYAAARRAA
jgi:hypothetical protein